MGGKRHERGLVRHRDLRMARERAAAAFQILAQRRAAPLMVRVLRRERKDAIAFAPWRIKRAVERDAPTRRREHAGEQLEQRSLAGAVRPDQPISMPRLE